MFRSYLSPVKGRGYLLRQNRELPEKSGFSKQKLRELPGRKISRVPGRPDSATLLNPHGTVPVGIGLPPEKRPLLKRCSDESAN